MKNLTTQQDMHLTLFSSSDGNVIIDVRIENETVWLTQKQIGELFTKSVKTISEHINNIFKDNELVENEVIRKSRITASDGNKRVGSFLFILYLQINKMPVKIDNIGLISLALLIAESAPAQKDLIIRLVINLLVK